MYRTHFAVVFTLAMVLGCRPSGPEMVPVSGTVTLDGHPLPTAEILFVPEEGAGNPSPGRVTDGRFDLLCLPGKMKVEIRATREFGEVDPAMGARPQQQYLPARYNTATELRAEVRLDSENNFAFELNEK